MSARDEYSIVSPAQAWCQRGAWALACGLAVLGGGGATEGFAQVSREYDVKAVFLFNLATFVEWPATAFATPEAPFVIGVLGNDPFGRVLDDIVAGEYVGKRPLVVRRFRRGDDVTACHLLFMADSEMRRVRTVLNDVRGRPVLTVADHPGFIEAGGMVWFTTRQNHLELFVNPQAARAAELVVSSKLLEVARVVDTFALAP